MQVLTFKTADEKTALLGILDGLCGPAPTPEALAHRAKVERTYRDSAGLDRFERLRAILAAQGIS